MADASLEEAGRDPGGVPCFTGALTVPGVLAASSACPEQTTNIQIRSLQKKRTDTGVNISTIIEGFPKKKSTWFWG